MVLLALALFGALSLLADRSGIVRDLKPLQLSQRVVARILGMPSPPESPVAQPQPAKAAEEPGQATFTDAEGYLCVGKLRVSNQRLGYG